MLFLSALALCEMQNVLVRIEIHFLQQLPVLLIIPPHIQCIFILKSFAIHVCWPTVVDGKPKAPSSIATAPRCMNCSTYP